MAEKFRDMKVAIRKAGLSQVAVAVAMSYRDDVFSKTLRGAVAPKGGLSDSDFRKAVKAAIKTLSEGTQQ